MFLSQTASIAATPLMILQSHPSSLWNEILCAVYLMSTNEDWFLLSPKLQDFPKWKAPHTTHYSLSQPVWSICTAEIRRQVQNLSISRGAQDWTDPWNMHPSDKCPIMREEWPLICSALTFMTGSMVRKGQQPLNCLKLLGFLRFEG